MMFTVCSINQTVNANKCLGGHSLPLFGSLASAGKKVQDDLKKKKLHSEAVLSICQGQTCNYYAHPALLSNISSAHQPD